MYNVRVFDDEKDMSRDFNNYVEAYKYAHMAANTFWTPFGATITRVADGTVLKHVIDDDSRVPEFNFFFELNGDELVYGYNDDIETYYKKVEEYAKYGEYNLKERAKFFNDAYKEYGVKALFIRM